MKNILKVKCDEIHEMPELIMAIFSVWIITVHNVFILNIVVILFLVLQLIKDKGKIKIESRDNLKLLVIYLAWVLFDVMLIFSEGKFDYNFRNIVQIAFEVQYAILFIRLKINYRMYFKWLVNIAFIYSVIVMLVFIRNGYLSHIAYLYTSYRDWTTLYFPGSSTSGPIPLIMALFVALINKDKVWKIIMITAGCLLFPARVSLLGVFLVYIYYFWEYVKRYLKIMFLMIAVLSIPLIVNIGNRIISIDASLIGRLFSRNDRMSIVEICIDFIKIHPLIGFGGNTLDRIFVAYNYVPTFGIYYQHAHNFILEVLIRYGIVGLALFLSYLFSYRLSIKSRDGKYMFFVFMIFALFQTYLREFYFLFFLACLTKLENNKYVSLDVNARTRRVKCNR